MKHRILPRIPRIRLTSRQLDSAPPLAHPSWSRAASDGVPDTGARLDAAEFWSRVGV